MGSASLPRALSLVRISSSSVPEKLCICRPPLLFQRDQINSLRNGREYDLKQIENAFRNPEDGLGGGGGGTAQRVLKYTRSKFEASVVHLRLNS